MGVDLSSVSLDTEAGQWAALRSMLMVADELWLMTSD